jgi:hypothetical protein
MKIKVWRLELVHRRTGESLAIKVFSDTEAQARMYAEQRNADYIVRRAEEQPQPGAARARREAAQRPPWRRRLHLWDE